MSESGRPASVPPTYVALLRGVNVGRAKRVAMADLRAVAAELGYGDARTLLNSGNLVFTAAAKADSTDVAEQLEKALRGRLGIDSRVTVLTAAEIAATVADNPFSDPLRDPSRLFVAFLRDPASRVVLEPLAAEDWIPEFLAMGRRVGYLWCPDGALGGRLSEAVGRALADRVTTRNWSTVMKLHGLMQT